MKALVSDIVADRTGALMKAASALWSAHNALTVLRPSPFIAPTPDVLRAYEMAKEFVRKAEQKLLLERLRLKWRTPK